MEEKLQMPSDLKDNVYSRQQYASATFWQDRYVENGGFFDWYAEFPQLKLAFNEYGITKQDKILMVGCGNSKLSDQMYQNGYKNIVNIDISPTVIDQMKEKFPYMVWEVMDATKMSYADGQFDVIIDKGTLDALISGKCFKICEDMLEQSMRVTKQSGQMILITYGSPEGRRKIFEKALPFHNYDYYQCRADLNDLSTMINLMRSNLPGQQLSNILKQQQAFKKTMREFSIIKMMRRNRKNTKQYIVWNKHQKTQIEFNPAHIQQPLIQSTKQQQKIIDKQIKNQQISQTSQIATQKTVQKPAQEQEFTYQPKKQPFVYVYSVRRKFTLGIEEFSTKEQQVFQKDQSNNIKIQSNNQNSMTIFVQQNLYQKVLTAIKFLKSKNIPIPNIFITSSSSLQQQLENSFKIKINVSKSSNLLCLRKTNFNLKIISFDNTKITIQSIFNRLKTISRNLIDKCCLHPCPKTYALFGILKNRKILPTVNQLLDKYWYPTWKIHSLSGSILDLQFSIPPVSAQKQEQIIKMIESLLAPLKGNVSQIRQGLISYVDLELYSIAGMACLSYSNEPIRLVVEEFWEKDQLSNSSNLVKEINNQLYNQVIHTIFVNSSILDRAIAHVIALY